MIEIHVPPYYEQETPETCGLATLRMALGHLGVQVSQAELNERVAPDYGTDFKTIWNPTIAKLACEYGLKTTFCAEWPLLKPANMEQAAAEYEADPDTMNIRKYENPDVTSEIPKPEPLPIAYKDMFRAVQLGCTYGYSRLSAEGLREMVAAGAVIHTTISLMRLYPDTPTEGMHDLLIFNVSEDSVRYHDPARGPDMRCTTAQLFESINNLGAFLSMSSSAT